MTVPLGNLSLLGTNGEHEPGRATVAWRGAAGTARRKVEPRRPTAPETTRQRGSALLGES